MRKPMNLHLRLKCFGGNNFAILLSKCMSHTATGVPVVGAVMTFMLDLHGFDLLPSLLPTICIMCDTMKEVATAVIIVPNRKRICLNKISLQSDGKRGEQLNEPRTCTRLASSLSAPSPGQAPPMPLFSKAHKKHDLHSCSVLQHSASPRQPSGELHWNPFSVFGLRNVPVCPCTEAASKTCEQNSRMSDRQHCAFTHCASNIASLVSVPVNVATVPVILSGGACNGDCSELESDLKACVDVNQFSVLPDTYEDPFLQFEGCECSASEFGGRSRGGCDGGPHWIPAGKSR